MSFNDGENVGPYRIIEQLGQGGMATVYKAYHAALDRYVALKVLHPAFLKDSHFLERFQREAKLVAKLDHPNIVPIYDYSEHEGRPYLVMKHIEGETLKARLEKGPIGKEIISQVAESVGAALTYAHKRGILHRDIKPSNVLMAEDGQIYLADFGLARIAQSVESTLTTDQVLGTPQYISPEQAVSLKDLDARSDIYSFGVMLYELTVGKVPFNADTPFSVIHDHIYTPLPMPRSVNPKVSEAIERVLLKALAKERDDRYKDIRSMVEAFQQALKEGDAEEAAIAWAASPTIPAPPRLAETSGLTDSQAEKLSADSETLPELQSAEGEEAAMQAAEEKIKKKSAWMWLAVSLILIAACAVTVLAFRGLGR
jgi:serine/threonine protein kinase